MFRTSSGWVYQLLSFTGSTVTVRRQYHGGIYGPPVKRVLERVNGRGAIRTEVPGVFAFTAARRAT